MEAAFALSPRIVTAQERKKRPPPNQRGQCLVLSSQSREGGRNAYLLRGRSRSGLAETDVDVGYIRVLEFFFGFRDCLRNIVGINFNGFDSGFGWRGLGRRFFVGSAQSDFNNVSHAGLGSPPHVGIMWPLMAGCQDTWRAGGAISY